MFCRKRVLNQWLIFGIFPVWYLIFKGMIMAGSTSDQKRFSLSNFLDYYIPGEMQVNPEAHRRSRMFMLSHVFGPFLGSSIPIYLMITGISRDYRVFIFLISVLSFWVYPLLLRATGRYQLLSFVSVQNLIFCVLWACYSFGAMSSPFIPWILMFPLLAFLYLPPAGWVRNVLLVQIYGSLGIFLAMVISGYHFPAVKIADLEVIGMISMAAVAVYFSMMSLYFAKMFQEQREFSRELNALVSTSDNVRNLTAAANQASAAKADFVASMSHELRTPLNAIIGYSQLLLEEAMDENDEVSHGDLSNIHVAGSDLLRLIDDILDYSRIEAGKMPVNLNYGSVRQHITNWTDDIQSCFASRNLELTVTESRTLDHIFSTDWNALRGALRHIAAEIAQHNSGGTVDMSFADNESGGVVFIIRGAGISLPNLEDGHGHSTFDHRDDASPTKYGSTGIEIALAYKFISLLGGEILVGRSAGHAQAFSISLPNVVERPAQFAIAA
jgi:signal transduction histidine kinase